MIAAALWLVLGLDSRSQFIEHIAPLFILEGLELGRGDRFVGEPILTLRGLSMPSVAPAPSRSRFLATSRILAVAWCTRGR